MVGQPKELNLWRENLQRETYAALMVLWWNTRLPLDEPFRPNDNIYAHQEIDKADKLEAIATKKGKNRYQLYKCLRDELYGLNFKAGYEFQLLMQEYWEWIADHSNS